MYISGLLCPGHSSLNDIFCFHTTCLIKQASSTNLTTDRSTYTQMYSGSLIGREGGIVHRNYFLPRSNQGQMTLEEGLTPSADPPLAGDAGHSIRPSTSSTSLHLEAFNPSCRRVVEPASLD